MKKAHIGRGTKVPHLSYVGDADLGEHTNIGGGTITANYDGVHKHHTTIGSDVHIGAGNLFVAPSPSATTSRAAPDRSSAMRCQTTPWCIQRTHNTMWSIGNQLGSVKQHDSIRIVHRIDPHRGRGRRPHEGA